MNVNKRTNRGSKPSSAPTPSRPSEDAFVVALSMREAYASRDPGSAGERPSEADVAGEPGTPDLPDLARAALLGSDGRTDRDAGLGNEVGRYYFSLESDLDPVRYHADAIGFEVQEGIRLHLQYDGGEVRTDAARYHADWNSEGMFAGTPDDDREALDRYQRSLGRVDWFGARGQVLSGGDWILVQKNGVAKFDARVTIRTNDDVLIDAVFTGAVDLRPAVPDVRPADPRDIGAEVFQWYCERGPQKPQLPVTLSVKFEAAEQPYLRPGEDGTWINKSRYAKQRKNFWKYQRLVRGLFKARGTVLLGDAKRWPPQRIALDIYELG